MSPSLRALLGGILDYAGLFPPAKLPLDQAIQRYAKYRRQGDHWMLGRFVIPAARVGELAPFDSLFHESPPFIFSVLGRGGDTADAFLQGLTDDLAAIAEFRERHGGRAEVDVLEVKLPDELTATDSPQASYYTLVRAVEAMEQFGPPVLKPFFEITLGVNWRTAVLTTLATFESLVRLGETRGRGPFRRCRPAGFKLRCVGAEPSAFPTPEQVAGVLVACRDHHVAFKATAGLHHPVRHYSESDETHMHGFLNLFGAAVFAAVHRLAETEVKAIVEDEDASHFGFDDAAFWWRGLRASAAEIGIARQTLATSFGSCSFDEPREDLRALRFLP